MNTYNSSLTNTYSDRAHSPLSRNGHTVLSKDSLPVNETVQEGQHLRGEIINRTTTDVTIRLTNGQTLQARLDASVPLSIGQTASFEVVHADPALISLRILQDEVASAHNALIQKALTAAELPLTTRNAEVVNTLLRHNLPISKESILSLVRQSSTYPNTDIGTLALMTQYKIPVTRATLTQFEAYRNYEHQILPQLENLAHSLGELASSSEPSLSGLVRTVQRLLQGTTGSFQPDQPDGISLPQRSGKFSAPSDIVTQIPLDSANHASISERLSKPLTEATGNTLFSRVLQTDISQPVLTASDSGFLVHNAPENMISPETTPPLSTSDPGGLRLPQSLQADTVPPVPTASDSGPLALTASDSAFLAQTASENAIFPEGSPLLFAAGTADLSLSPAQQTDTPPAPTASGSFISPEHSLTPSATPTDSVTIPETVQTETGFAPKTLELQLFTRWTLSPKELASPDQVKDFYERLREDLVELHTALRSLRNKDSAESPVERLLSDTANATQQLQENLEFMNMLNRIFPYVQFPIRLSDKTAHGELYVYTKKEKLRSKDGSLSVLLHLDMEALGPTDIYLSLSNQQLTSRFYLNDSALEKLFTEHLPELKETLSEKGFSVNFELVARKQEEDPVREFLNSHDNSGLSRFSFDCRA